jgi:hypothetical protein
MSFLLGKQLSPQSGQQRVAQRGATRNAGGLCLAFVLTGSQSREAIAAGVSQWSAVRSIGEARRADTPVCRVSDAAWFFLRPSTRSRARLLPAASSTLNTYRWGSGHKDRPAHGVGDRSGWSLPPVSRARFGGTGGFPGFRCRCTLGYSL